MESKRIQQTTEHDKKEADADTRDTPAVTTAGGREEGQYRGGGIRGTNYQA